MIDLKALKKIYNLTKELSYSDIQVLLKASKRHSFNKKELIIEFGSNSSRVFFIQKGLVRSYAINDQGKEVTYGLHPEFQIVANVDYVFLRSNSRFYYEAYEKTIVYSLDYDCIDLILEKNESLRKNKKYIYEKIMRQMFSRVESFVFLSSEERYEKFLEDFPGLANRVSDKHIAQVLGITPVTLSRIRSNIMKKHNN